MASTYFSVPSFARAKKNKEDLEKTNPQEPVLKDDDEKFLETQITSNEAEQYSQDIPAAKITDDGEEKEASPEEQAQAGGSVAVPDTQPESTDGTADPDQQQEETSYDDVMKERAAARVKARKEKKRQSAELPSQEEAEAATRGFNSKMEKESSPTQKQTWSSYLSSVTPTYKRPDDGRTWSEYASSYVPNMPKIPDVSLPSLKRKNKDQDAEAKVVYNEDGTVNEEATKDQQEREVGVLLDNLNLSSINNRVFAFSAETQKIYERFAQCLKDIINGVPTAYEDMDKLMKEAGPKIEAQFQSMPPFVQTLVKSLPMRIGSTLGPEFLAAASKKPGADMNARLAAASQPGAADSGINLASTSTTVTEKAEDGTEKKKKRRIPGLKSLAATNAAAVLMFVFWYSHKRGREVRLAREAEEAGAIVDDGEDVLEVELTDEDEELEEEAADLEKEIDEKGADLEKEIEDKANVLNQPNPTEVPLPVQNEEEKVAEEEKRATLDK